MWRHIASNTLTFLVVALFLLGGIILWGQREYHAPGPLTAQSCVQVAPGSSFRDASMQLEEVGAIEYGAVFRMAADYTGKADQLKAGSWLIPDGASMSEITDIITRGGASSCGTIIVYRIGITSAETQVRELDTATGRYVEQVAFDPAVDAAPEAYTQLLTKPDTRYRVAVAEGVTSWQVADALGRVDILTGELAGSAPEGSLAPNSYDISKGDTRQSVIDRMSEAQETLLELAWENRVEGLPLSSPEELLILASIIEKETGLPEERRQVASVFTNRLNQGMRLQTDPTVIYGITKGEGILGRGLRRSELDAETPWNTYVIPGLPPTPIANPGRASLEAAADPDSTEYIFFVADGTGGHAFAVTLDEHNKNVAEWRKIEAERAAD